MGLGNVLILAYDHSAPGPEILLRISIVDSETFETLLFLFKINTRSKLEAVRDEIQEDLDNATDPDDVANLSENLDGVDDKLDEIY